MDCFPCIHIIPALRLCSLIEFLCLFKKKLRKVWLRSGEFSNIKIKSSAERLLWILLPALTGVAQTKGLLPSLGCLSVKWELAGYHAALFCSDVLRLSDERDEGVSSWIFLQFMDNKVWGLLGSRQ